MRLLLILSKNNRNDTLAYEHKQLAQIPVFIVFIFLLSESAHSQDSSSLFNRLLSFPDKVFGRIDKEANKYEQKLRQQTEMYLNKLERQKA